MSPIFEYPADVPVGEQSAEKAKSPGRRSGLTDRDTAADDGEHWFDREDARRGEDEDGDRDRRREGGTVHSRFEDKDITDLKMVCPLCTYSTVRIRRSLTSDTMCSRCCVTIRSWRS